MKTLKWSITLLIICSLVGLFTGCDKKTEDSVSASGINISSAEESENTDNLAEVQTNLGTFYIPQKYEQVLQITTNDTDNGGTVRFSTEQDEKSYSLFELSIGDETGQLAGSITDPNGTSRSVFVTISDLGDISSLSQDKQDQLYALQETVNVVVENLK